MRSRLTASGKQVTVLSPAENAWYSQRWCNRGLSGVVAGQRSCSMIHTGSSSLMAAPGVVHGEPGFDH